MKDQNNQMADAKLQYVSDLHLDTQKDLGALKSSLGIIVKAPVLVVAGDIIEALNPTWDVFIELVSSLFEHVIIVPGNHEYYNFSPSVYGSVWTLSPSSKFTIDYINGEMKEVCSKFSNVHLLLDEVCRLEKDKITFIGGTMWTQIPENECYAIKSRMNDYNYIFGSDGRRVEPEKLNSLHSHFCDFLSIEMEKVPKDETLVVVTHHCPLPYDKDLFPQASVETESAYFTDMTDWMKDRETTWICGHTHEFLDKKVGSTRVINHPFCLDKAFGLVYL
jgi:predicted phosphodiesterase